MILDKIASPADLRALDHQQLDELCEEIREFIVQSVSKTGGHLGSNLGAVELTIALHRVFESPRDVLLWDTGHQAYVHKLVTGRRDEFDQLRQRHGLSGYPSRAESDHDWVENSHASTSLSYAYGIASGFATRGEDHRTVVAVVGDGSLTGGMAFEALNNLGHKGRRAVIVLNDNGRSYAPTVSRLSTAVSRLRMKPKYVRSKSRLGEVLDKVPLGGEVKRGVRGAAAAMREMWEPPAFFETLGVRYTGPVDGHDIAELEAALQDAAEYDGPIVVHVLTQKGLGYSPAEDDEEKHLHDTGLFDPATGPAKSSSGKRPEYSAAFSEALLTAAEDDPSIVAITAAMPGSTGLIPFQERFPDRFYDVSIAEQHAVTAAAGMAMTGLRPVIALYSTFLARAFDQLTYDVGLHELPVVFCLDRAGITGPDGASHHGVLDMAMCLRVPGMTIFAPSCSEELTEMFGEAMKITSGPVALRWGRGSAPSSVDGKVGSGRQARKLRDGSDVAILAVGSQVHASMEAAEQLAAQGVECAVWDVRVVAPLDRSMLREAADFAMVVTVEDGIRVGGAGSSVADALTRLTDVSRLPRTLAIGTPVDYLPHGDASVLKAELGLDGAGIAATIYKQLNQSAIR
jgi:1-deoxy-D-xylulose-5-phosphate synthase